MTINRHQTLLSLITGSVGGRTWQHLHTDEGDILRGGELSCAYFVCSLLLTAGLIKNMHATVAGCELELRQCGWHQTKKPQPGDVVFWVPRVEKGETHAHVGFYINEDTAISNSSRRHVPYEHHLTFRHHRPIVAVWTHSDLQK